jgi:hypothetical protein
LCAFRPAHQDLVGEATRVDPVRRSRYFKIFVSLSLLAAVPVVSQKEPYTDDNQPNYIEPKLLSSHSFFTFGTTFPSFVSELRGLSKLQQGGQLDRWNEGPRNLGRLAAKCAKFGLQCNPLTGAQLFSSHPPGCGYSLLIT